MKRIISQILLCLFCLPLLNAMERSLQPELQEVIVDANNGAGVGDGDNQFAVTLPGAPEDFSEDLPITNLSKVLVIQEDFAHAERMICCTSWKEYAREWCGAASYFLSLPVFLFGGVALQMAVVQVKGSTSPDLLWGIGGGGVALGAGLMTFGSCLKGRRDIAERVQDASLALARVKEEHPKMTKQRAYFAPRPNIPLRSGAARVEAEHTGAQQPLSLKDACLRYIIITRAMNTRNYCERASRIGDPYVPGALPVELQDQLKATEKARRACLRELAV